MSDKEQIQWNVSVEVVDQFAEAVTNRWGEFSGVMGREMETAMLEYMDRDPYSEAEWKLDQLLEIIGVDREGLNKDVKTRSGPRGETTPVNKRVQKKVADRFRRYSDESTDDHVVGLTLEKAMVAYCSGGRSARLEEKVDRAIDAAEPNADRSSTIGRQERNAMKILEAMDLDTENGASFLLDDFKDAVLNSDASVSQTTYAATNHLPIVLEKIGYEEHPSNPELYIPEETAREYESAQDTVAIDKKKWDHLTAEEKVEGVRIELAREAKGRSSWMAKYDAEDVTSLFRDHEPTKQWAYNVMDKVATEQGFEAKKKDGSRVITVDLGKVMEQRYQQPPKRDDSKSASVDDDVSMDDLTTADYGVD